MASKNAVIKLAEKFIHDLHECNVSLKRAYLFGSYANNNATAVSDIDIALVADDFKGVSYIDIDKIMKVKIRKEYAPIHIQTFNTKYFNRTDAFADEIVNSGIELKIK